MSRLINPPPWRPEALIWIFFGAVGMPVSGIIFRGDLTIKTLVLAVVAVPVGAICGYFVWGYWENVGRK